MYLRNLNISTSRELSRCCKFQLLKIKDKNWFNIRSSFSYLENGDRKYLSPNNRFGLESQFYRYYEIYVTESTLNESDSAQVMFIEAQIESISANNYILGTNLTANTYYCIQTINDKNETQFLKWDGIEYQNPTNYWGLSLHKINENQCHDDD